MNSFNEKNGLIRNIQFSESEQQEFMIKLWELLKIQVGKYNGVDSTSIRIEKAQELLESLVYTLFVVVQEECLEIDELLQKDFSPLIQKGQTILDEKRKTVKNSWCNMCKSVPYIENYYYFDTIKNLGIFFKSYNIYYEADKIPCSIEYPLINAIPDEIKGISYIEEYIRRIQLENKFINYFDINTVVRLLESSIPDYKEAYFNLCELAFTNALGRKLLQKEIKSLDIPKDQQQEIVMLLSRKTDDEFNSFIYSASELVCKEVGVNDVYSLLYFNNAARELSVRINSALESGDLSHVFISFLPKGIILN